MPSGRLMAAGRLQISVNDVFMEDDVKSGLKGCLSLFLVTGIVLSYCFQCAHDRDVEERERRFRESEAGCRAIDPIRAKDTRRTTPPDRPLGAAYEWRLKSAEKQPACWEKDGYDSFENWYYAEMDVVGEGEYPDM